jgi:hypothetical protein
LAKSHGRAGHIQQHDQAEWCLGWFKRHDGPAHVVFVDDEIVLRQAGDRLSLPIDNPDVQLHQRSFCAEDIILR